MLRLASTYCEANAPSAAAVPSLPSLCRYEGGWRNDKMHGKGTYWAFVPVATRKGAAAVAALGGGSSGESADAGGSVADSEAESGRGSVVRPGTQIRGNLVKVYEGEYADGKRHGSGRLHYGTLARVNAALRAAGLSRGSSGANSSGSGMDSSNSSSSASGLFAGGSTGSASALLHGFGAGTGTGAGFGRATPSASARLGGFGTGTGTTAGAGDGDGDAAAGGVEGRDVYEGSFVNGQPEGTGALRYADGSLYAGQWRAGRRHGHGVLVLPNGDRYVGGWCDDRKHGPGRFLYFSRDRVYAGEWADDVARCGEMSSLTHEERASVGDLAVLAAATGGTLSALATTTAAAAAATASSSAEAARHAAAAAVAYGGSGVGVYGDGDSGVPPSAPPNPVSLPRLQLAAPEHVLQRAILATRAEAAGMHADADALRHGHAAGGHGMHGSGAGAAGSAGVGVGPDGDGYGYGGIGDEGSLMSGGGGSMVSASGSFAGSSSSVMMMGGGPGGAGLSPLYRIDASAIELSGEEVAQLTMAFRSGDASGGGRIPADARILGGVLSTLGIPASEDDVAALLRELTAMETAAAASASVAASASASGAGGSSSSSFIFGGASSVAGGSGGAPYGISFPVFAACMARLRE